MSTANERKSHGKRRQRSGQLPSNRKTRTKMTCSFPDSLSDESSFDGNYLDNYSTESDYSDGPSNKLDETSSGEEPIQGNDCYSRIFNGGDAQDDLFIETREERMDKLFSELRKKYPAPPDSHTKSKSKGDFTMPDIFRTKSKSGPQASTSGGREKPPDPKSAPEPVLRLRKMEDLTQNRKVMDYIKELEAYEEDVNKRLAAKEKVPREEILALNKARDAILKQFGYNLSDKAEMERDERKARRRIRKKNEFPSGVSVSSSSDSEDSEKILKEEVTRRVLQTGDGDVSNVDFSDLIKHSPKWKACVEEEMLDPDHNGKLENLTKLTKKIVKKKNKF